MDRSRRPGATSSLSATSPPPSSRLTVRRKNRRRPGALWTRLPKPRAIADACGRALRRSLPAAAAVAAIAALSGAAWAGHRWMTSSSRFAITEISIRGTHHLREDELRAQLPVHGGDNVFADLGGIAQAVRANPWVASADVHRILPHTITIDVREHAAAAVIELSELGELGELYLLNAAGRPFKRA